MTTAQKYVGRGNCANTPPYHQEELDSLRDSFGKLTDENLDNLQDYFGSNAGASCIETVNRLLQGWLLKQRPDFSLPSNAKLLASALDLVNFLTDLHHQTNELSFFKEKLQDLLPSPSPAYPAVSLLVATTVADNNGSRSELTLLREALDFYEQKLRSDADAQQNPTLLLDAATLHDMQANLTEASLSFLSPSL